jgi:8-oxo-dGTP pyrophosphatase MutT (NUDIX family)
VNDEELRETPLSSRDIHSGRLISVRDDTVRLGNGRTAHREVVQHPGAVAVVAIDDADRVVLVRQWRHPLGRATWEVPAGTRDVRGEEPAETARRELAEEAALAARTWRHLGSAPLTPGYSTEEIDFYLATDLQPAEAHQDDDELVHAGRFDRAGVAGLLRDGEIDIKTIGGLALAGWSLSDG